MVLTLCNLRWWCLSCHRLAQRLHLHLQWASHATCTGGVSLVPTSAFTNVHICLVMHAATADCNFHWWWLFLYQPGTNVNICTWQYLATYTVWWRWLYAAYKYIIPENGPCYHHLLRRTSWWQKRPNNGPLYHHLLKQASCTATETTRKWFMLFPSAKADLMVTERSQSGPCYHHLLKQTSWWQKDQKIVHAITMC